MFITTSSYTEQAKQTAAKARGSIVLLDGEQLAALMIETRVGVSHEVRNLPRIDTDYFERD